MQIDNEDLTFSLETVVERFSGDMAPYAVGLVSHLTGQFWRIVASEDEEDDDDGALGALGMLYSLGLGTHAVLGMLRVLGGCWGWRPLESCLAVCGHWAI